MLYERSDETVTLIPFVTTMMGGSVFLSLFVLLMLPTVGMLAKGRKV